MAIAPITAHFYQFLCLWGFIFLTARSKSDTDKVAL